VTSTEWRTPVGATKLTEHERTAARQTNDLSRWLLFLVELNQATRDQVDSNVESRFYHSIRFLTQASLFSMCGMLAVVATVNLKYVDNVHKRLLLRL
jgi:hypothetical protein